MTLLERPTASRLARLARMPAARAGGEPRCDLCAQPLASEHRHLLELERSRIRCVCGACALLFDRGAAGGVSLRRIPDRHLRIPDFRLDDGQWERLAIPVGLAFFQRSTRAQRTIAFYPGAMGATESRLGLDAWSDLEAENPVLERLEPDVEALLVRRLRGARDCWLVPIDACFRLVAVLRSRWKGLSGGSEVWRAVDDYFDDLRRRARPVDRHGRPS